MMVDSKGNPKPRRTIESTEPFYWEKLEHQYAGMAMQGILSNEIHTKHLLESSTSAEEARDTIVSASRYIAHALVHKLKEKEERK